MSDGTDIATLGFSTSTGTAIATLGFISTGTTTGLVPAPDPFMATAMMRIDPFSATSKLKGN